LKLTRIFTSLVALALLLNVFSAKNAESQQAGRVQVPSESLSLLEGVDVQQFVRNPALRHSKKLKAKPAQELSKKEIQDGILRTYKFPLDLESDTPKEYPLGWPRVRGWKEKALHLGKPLPILRENVETQFPLFIIPQLNYFKGEEPAYSLLNGVVSYWNKKRFAEAYKLLLRLDKELAQVPQFSLVYSVKEALKAHFHLQFSLSEKGNIIDENSPGEFSAEQHFSLSRQSFWKAFGAIEETLLHGSVVPVVHSKLFNKLFLYPQYFDARKFLFGTLPQLNAVDEPLEPQIWLRTVAVTGFWNLAVLSRGYGMWDRSFDAGDKLESLLAAVLAVRPLVQKEEISFQSPVRPLFKSEPWLSPQNAEDLVAAIPLIQGLAYQKGKDPILALENFDKGIRRAKSNELRAAYFWYAGHVYFDLGKREMARKTFAWSEAFSESFLKKQPSGLFLGAEAAFWNGKYQTALRGFDKFLDVSGDPQYGPWARLRIAEIQHVLNGENAALHLYEELLRLYPVHAVNAVTQVRIYCILASEMPTRVREQKYEELKVSIAETPSVLHDQAKACLMRSDLAQEAENSSPEARASKDMAARQLNILKKFEVDFPNNEYSLLFDERKKALKLADAVVAASQQECQKLIESYKLKRESLHSLGDHGKIYVKGLAWGPSEQVKVVRCSALLEDFALWDSMDEQKIPIKDRDKIPLQLRQFLEMRSDTEAVKLYRLLSESAKRSWKTSVKNTETKGFQLINEDSFWEDFSIRKIEEFDLVQTPEKKKKFGTEIQNALLKNPQFSFENEMFCFWFIEQTEKMKAKDWDVYVKKVGKTPEEWVALMKNEKSQCSQILAMTLYRVSLVNPSALRDANILLPYMKMKGIQEASEEWLAFAFRLASVKGRANPDVVTIFRDLSKQAKDTVVQNSAKMWLENNRSQDQGFWKQ
jgi:tetratricopeptide (TPR) repeat protein